MAQEASKQIVIFDSTPGIHCQQAIEAVESTEFRAVFFNEENSAKDELGYSCQAVIAVVRHDPILLNVTGADLLNTAEELKVPRAILIPPELGWWVTEKVHMGENDVSLPLGRRRPRIQQGIATWLANMNETSG